MGEIPPILNETSAPGPARRFRWQFIVLGLGLVMIAAAGLFMLMRQPDNTPANVQSIDFVQTQVYSEAIVGQPRLVNPLLATSQADRDLAELIFSGLTRLDDFGQPVPDLATGWDVSADGLTYTFHLREDATWQDGQPFTADDVAYTMSVLRDDLFGGPSDLATFWRTVETYAVDAHTVRFMLTQPLAAFPEYTGIGLLPAHLLAGIEPGKLADDSFNLAPVGTGRMTWVSSQTDSGVMTVNLAPYPDFYDAARRVSLDGMVLRFYPDADKAFRALARQSAPTLGYGGLTTGQLDAAIASPNLNIYSARLPITAEIIFNQQAPDRLPFFQQVEVRQALTSALDRASLVQQALPREALPAVSPLLPGTWAYDPTLQPLPYDPTGAAALLDQAGWASDGGTRSKDGTPLSFTLLVANTPGDKAIGQAVVEAWKALGVGVTLQTLDPAQLVTHLQTKTDQGRDFDAALVELSQGRLADPDPYPFWHQSQIEDGQNYSGFSDRDISEAIEVARKDPNGVRRAELYHSFQQLFVQRAAAVLLFNPVYNYAVSCQVQGVQLMIFVDPGDRFRNLQDWRIVSPEEAGQVCPGP